MSDQSMHTELRGVQVELSRAIKAQWTTLDAAEEAFRKAIEYHEYALLISAVAAYQIAERRLYEPAFSTLNAYLMESKERLGISRAYFFERVRIADAYIKYHDQLRARGFRENRHSSHLRFFYQAVEEHGATQAIENIAKMSVREYRRWIGGVEPIDEIEDTRPSDVDVSANGIRYRGELVISARAVLKLYKSGQQPYVVGIRSDEEKRAVSKFLRKLRAGGGE